MIKVVKGIWTACQSSGTAQIWCRSIRSYRNSHTAIALELLVILFPRPQELRYAKWQDFDFEKKIWIKPAETMKCGITHVVPLPKQAIELLFKLKEIRTVSGFFIS